MVAHRCLLSIKSNFLQWCGPAYVQATLAIFAVLVPANVNRYATGITLHRNPENKRATQV
jgi:hypothetical protein